MTVMVLQGLEYYLYVSGTPVRVGHAFTYEHKYFTFQNAIVESRAATLCVELLSRSICNLHVIKSVISTSRNTVNFANYTKNLCCTWSTDSS